MTPHIQHQDTHWAENLTQEHLHMVIWLVGEFLPRHGAVFALLHEHLQPLDADHECRRAFEKLKKLCHGQTLDAADANPALPVISDRLRQQFPIGKYTRWAIDLSDADLHAILANIGSFANDADSLFDLLYGNAKTTEFDYVPRRASFALKSLVDIARGQRYNVNEYCQRWNTKKNNLGRWITDESPTGDFDLGLKQ